MKKLSEEIKNKRIEKGITQKELADRVGVSRIMINYYESGRRRPSPSVLSKIAKQLELPRESLKNMMTKNLRNYQVHYAFRAEGITPNDIKILKKLIDKERKAIEKKNN